MTKVYALPPLPPLFFFFFFRSYWVWCCSHFLPRDRDPTANLNLVLAHLRGRVLGCFHSCLTASPCRLCNVTSEPVNSDIQTVSSLIGSLPLLFYLHFIVFIGIHGTALQWYSSYLSNRTQTVSINNLKSDLAPVFYGVPQGSVLGPVLFVLYTTPLSDVTERHAIHHHSNADDTQLRKSAPPHHVSELVQSMQECLHDVKRGCPTIN